MSTARDGKARCAKCGAEFEDTVRFCPECGADTGRADAGRARAPLPERSFGERKTTLGGGGRGIPPARADARAAVSVGDAVTMGPAAGSTPNGAAGGAGEAVEERYELLEEIGRGGFARVWKARDRKLERLVALKRLTPEALSGPEGGRTLERFRREAQAVASLNHRNIVGVYDRGEDDGGPYIVMEYVEGGSLRGLLEERGKLETAEAVRIACLVARGLEHAHRKNLVHRDIKPANILLSQEGGETIPKIADFGLARIGVDTGVSMSGYGMGTQAYMPPEQRRDAKSVNHTADIYALGKTLYEMVTGLLPDDVDVDSLPPGLKEIIKKCVRPNPEERYFSAADLLADLERAGSGGEESPERKLPAGASPDNVCPACGQANAARVKFCVGCGAGLVRVCPECGGDVSVRTPFCGVCGTDVDGFERFRDGVLKMEKYAKDKQWGRVLKEHGLLPASVRMTKIKGRDLIVRAGTAKAEADRMLAEMEAFRKTADRSAAEGLWSEAWRAAKAYLALNPHDSEMGARIPELESRADEEAWVRAQWEVKKREGAGLMEDAPCSVHVYLRDHPEGKHVTAARGELERLGRLAALDLLRAQLLSGRDFKGVEKQIGAMIEAGLSEEGAAALRACTQKEFGVLADQRGRRWKLAARFAAAGLALAAALAGALALFERWRDREAAALLSEAGEAVARKDWTKALALTEVVKGFRPGNPQLAVLRKEVCAALAPSAGRSWVSPATGMTFVWVPALKLWVGKYEVTNGEYRKMKRRHTSKGVKELSLNGDRQPVVQVCFEAAKAYAEWMTVQDLDRLCDGAYRLPTEAEWEHFSMCGSARKYPWGNDWPPKFGNYADLTAVRLIGFAGFENYDDKSALTCPVEQSGENDWGLFGVGGNVWECCVKDPSGASFGAWRGASWANMNSGDLQCAFRCLSEGSTSGATFGFRVVLTRAVSEARSSGAE